jgi:hypothetical protein
MRDDGASAGADAPVRDADAAIACTLGEFGAPELHRRSSPVLPQLGD